ncbi:porin [Vibrio cortegadensis]|uniref:Porin n=1 Tax=Vibrio cortegadensis TaxID=1328770 RepID=A0ABV4M7R9_9VIBR
MKKTLLALAVVAAAGSVNAAEIYNKDGVAVSVGGAAEVQYFKGFEKDSDATIRLDDGELNFGTTVAINDELNAVGYFDFEFENRDDSGAGSTTENAELYAGIETNGLKATVGRQYTIGDEAGIGEDYELGTESIGLGDAHGSEVMKLWYTGDKFWVAFAHDLDNGKAGDKTITDFGASFTPVDALELRAFYYTEEAYGAANTIVAKEISSYNLEAIYSFSDFTIAGSFGSIEDDKVANSDVDIISLAGTYTMGKNTFALGYNQASKYKEDVNNVYANITHKLHSNVKAYAEVGYADSDDSAKDYDFAYVAGLEVKF